MANITYYISASYIGEGLSGTNFLLFHTECNNPTYQITYNGDIVITSSSLADGLALTLDDSITTLHLYPVSEDCPLGCGYNYSINLVPPAPPTPTPSVTPSITPTISSTPGASSTPAPSSIPDSPTPSISVSGTPGASQTPSPSVTPSISVTPSTTPSISSTPSISVTPTISKTPPSSATPSVTPSLSTPTASCIEYAFTAFGGTVVFQYYDCFGQAQSATVYNGYPIRRCVEEGTSPSFYPVDYGAIGTAENLGNIC